MTHHLKSVLWSHIYTREMRNDLSRCVMNVSPFLISYRAIGMPKYLISSQLEVSSVVHLGCVDNFFQFDL